MNYANERSETWMITHVLHASSVHSMNSSDQVSHSRLLASSLLFMVTSNLLGLAGLLVPLPKVSTTPPLLFTLLAVPLEALIGISFWIALLYQTLPGKKMPPRVAAEGAVLSAALITVAHFVVTSRGIGIGIYPFPMLTMSVGCCELRNLAIILLLAASSFVRRFSCSPPS